MSPLEKDRTFALWLKAEEDPGGHAGGHASVPEVLYATTYVRAPPDLIMNNVLVSAQSVHNSVHTPNTELPIHTRSH